MITCGLQQLSLHQSNLRYLLPLSLIILYYRPVNFEWTDSKLVHAKKKMTFEWIIGQVIVDSSPSPLLVGVVDSLYRFKVRSKVTLKKISLISTIEQM